MDHTALAANQVIEETFLSPRVVDSALLSEFAESLRALLGQAAVQGEQLRTAVTQGEAVAQSLTDTATKAGEKLRPAVKLIPTIDQKLARAEEALARASEAAASAELAAGEAARTASAEGAVALRRAQQAFDTALERARDVEARLGQLTERAEMAVEALDAECRSRLNTATKHAQDVLGTLVAELDARAEEAIGRLNALLDERWAAAGAAVSGVIEIAGTAPMGENPLAESPPGEPHPAAASLGAAAAATAEAQADIETLIQSIKSRAETIGEQLADHAARAMQRAEEATRKAAQAGELARVADARLEVAQEQLRLIDERGREIAAGASQALAAFDAELTGRIHAVHEMMEQLAGVTDRREPTHTAGQQPPATPTPTPEIKPLGETPQLIRIDRPAGESDAGAGLPGRLRF